MITRTSIYLAALCLASTAANASDFYLEARTGISSLDDTADTDGLQQPPQDGPLEGVPIDGLPFDSDETAWGLLAGWQIRDWLALEAGYTDLGESTREVGFAAIGGVVTGSRATLAIEEWYVGARFSKALSERFAANWALGVSRASFDVEGSLPVFVGPIIGPSPTPEQIPFTTPDDETGLVWGFGFNWLLNERLALGIGYRQHNTNVLDVESLTLGLRVNL